MGGDLTCSSEEDKGSNFVLQVPLRVGEIRKKVFERADTVCVSGRKLLIIDDVAVNRRMFQSIAEAWGMEVLALQSGEQALMQGEVFRPDVVITDYQMPDMDGARFVSLMRQHSWGADIPALLCSTVAINRSDLPDDLFAEVLLKPVRESTLFNCLNHALSGLDTGKTSGRKYQGHLIDGKLAELCPLRILVVEDNFMNLRVIGHILKKMGYTMDAVGDGVEAVDALQRQTYDLILMDMEMPRMSGLEATRQIRALPLANRPYIAALTANVIGEQKSRCLAAGMDDFLAKPVRIPALEAIIQQAFDVLPVSTHATLNEEDGFSFWLDRDHLDDLLGEDTGLHAGRYPGRLWRYLA